MRAAVVSEEAAQEMVHRSALRGEIPEKVGSLPRGLQDLMVLIGGPASEALVERNSEALVERDSEALGAIGVIVLREEILVSVDVEKEVVMAGRLRDGQTVVSAGVSLGMEGDQEEAKDVSIPVVALVREPVL
jgi:hypothetical protein